MLRGGWLTVQLMTRQWCLKNLLRILQEPYVAPLYQLNMPFPGLASIETVRAKCWKFLINIFSIVIANSRWNYEKKFFFRNRTSLKGLFSYVFAVQSYHPQYREGLGRSPSASMIISYQLWMSYLYFCLDAILIAK